MNLFEEISAAVPTKVSAQPKSWPKKVWLHRLDTTAVMAIAKKQPTKEGADNTPFLVELVAASLGSEEGPCDFNTDAAKAWLARNPRALNELGTACIELNELTEPNAERKN